jgi:toxin HigB-1
MIESFNSKTAQDIYDGTNTRLARKIPVELHAKIQRLFDQLNAVTKVETLRLPPSNRLEKLKGNLKKYWSLRVNHQWRIIFQWESGTAHRVDVVDYH